MGALILQEARAVTGKDAGIIGVIIAAIAALMAAFINAWAARNGSRAVVKASHIAATATIESTATKAHVDSQTAFLEGLVTRVQYLEEQARASEQKRIVDIAEANDKIDKEMKLRRDMEEKAHVDRIEKQQLIIEFNDFKVDTLRKEEACARKCTALELRLAVCEQTHGRVMAAVHAINPEEV